MILLDMPIDHRLESRDDSLTRLLLSLELRSTGMVCIQRTICPKMFRLGTGTEPISATWRLLAYPLAVGDKAYSHGLGGYPALSTHLFRGRCPDMDSVFFVDLQDFNSLKGRSYVHTLW